MTSKELGASENALIDLIYQHLQENGYKKAASALKRHVPQVETTSPNVSLDDIFKKWVSEEQEKKNDEGKEPQRSSVPNTESAKNAAHNTSPEKKVKSQTPAAARNQKRKRSVTKTHRSSSAVGSQTTEHSPTSPATGEDSDSDSSLDVEKWKRLALQISDADIAKMDAFTNFSTSTAKPTRKRKPAQPKKKQDQTIGNGKPSPKRTKVKSTTNRTKTEKNTTPLKPTAFSICESDKVKTPSKKAGIADPNVKSPESVTDQLATPQTGVSNGLSESDKIKVKRKKTHSISESDNIETPTKKAEKTNDVSEPTLTGTPCKKTKSKKDVKVTKPGNLETPSRVTDSEEAIQKSQCALESADLFESNSSKQSEGVLHSNTVETKAKKGKSKKVKIVAAVGVDTSIQTVHENESGFLTSDQSKINQASDFIPTETPSKKAKPKKSKKSKEHQDPEDVTMPSGECQIKGDHSHSNPHQTEILSTSVTEDKSVEGSGPVAKQSKKAKKSSLDPNGAEKPSKKIETQAATSILEPLCSETPSKKSKTKKAPETSQLDPPSKKNVADVVEGEATKSSSSISDHNNLPKKSKRKRTESSGENVASSGTEHPSKSSECDHSGLDNSFIHAGNSIEESVLAVEEEGNPEPKKKKKKKKDKEKSNESDEIVEEVPLPAAAAAEEIADSLPSSQKKKKKKKQKHGDEKMPSVSTPAPEVDSPKKKKKSSKEKEHADV